MDELTDTDSDVKVQHVALPIPLVKIVPFPDFNNLQPMMPHQIQVEDLFGFDGNEDNVNNNNQEPKHLHQNIQIGLVQIVQPLLTQSLEICLLLGAYHLWVKLLKLQLGTILF